MLSAKESACLARKASHAIAHASTEQKNDALRFMAEALREQKAEIIAANQQDVSQAREGGVAEPLIDRLMLDEARIASIADALLELVELDDPTGRVLEARTLESGISLEKIQVPLGVVAMVYEARPNVTVDAAGICVKSGNACVLKGGSLAFHTNRCLVDILRFALAQALLPADVVVMLESCDRSATDELLTLRGLIDVLIPRGGAGLIAHCVNNARVPVIETGTGNCHVYIHEKADVLMARKIILNAKTQRPGVCNACESVLVDRSIAEEALIPLMKDLTVADVRIHGDETVAELAQRQGIPVDVATEQDWGREYLDLEISIKVVKDKAEAIDHINCYGTMHSECIVTEDVHAAESFLEEVDASAVYWNASTRFTDGGMFGLGAEIGISTQKVHVRGPFALEALTTTKYLLRGEGQIRA